MGRLAKVLASKARKAILRPWPKHKLKDGLDASVSVVKNNTVMMFYKTLNTYEQEKKEEQLDSLTGE